MAITKPYTFQAGTKARASEVNQDFDILYSEVNRIGTEILNLDIDIQNVAEDKANVNGNAGQIFKMANPENSYDGVNKNYLENSIANIKDYISGYTIAKDTDNSVIVSSGSCYDSTYSTVITSTGNITKQNTSQLANGTYYIYIISDDSGRQVDALITTESITPPLPTGYTLYRQIGYYTTDSDNKIDSIGYYGERSNSDKSVYGVISAVMPDYDNGVDKTLNTTYTAEADGWLIFRSHGTGSYVWYMHLYINDILIQYFYCNEAANACSYCVPIRKGDTYRTECGAGAGMYKFYPSQGGNQ